MVPNAPMNAPPHNPPRPALYLPSRLKRLADQILTDSLSLVRELDLPLNPSNAPLMSLLYTQGPQKIGHAAGLLGVAQPTVTQAISRLVELGLAEVRRDDRDQRVRRVALTEAGRTSWTHAEILLLHRLNETMSELVGGDDGPIFLALQDIETKLSNCGFHDRVKASSALGIWARDYTDELEEAFRSITTAWLSEAGVLELDDQSGIIDPRASILDRGGAIIAIEAYDVGVVAFGGLLPVTEGVVEIVRMGVTPTARGCGVGRFLLGKLLERASANGARLAFLLTRENLKPALNLYKGFGFKPAPELLDRFGKRDPRAQIALSLHLTDERYDPTPTPCPESRD